jgi:hypothetical protein
LIPEQDTIVFSSLHCTVALAAAAVLAVVVVDNLVRKVDLSKDSLKLHNQRIPRTN